MSNYLNEASPVTVVLGGVNPNVYGAFVELIASTARESGWLWIFYHAVGAFLSFGGNQIKMNIATGGAGSEVVKQCAIGQSISSGSILPGGYWQGYSLPWTFGTGVRLSCQIADENTLFAASYRVKIRLWEKPFP